MTVVKGKLQVFSSHVFAIGLIGDGRQYGDGMGLEKRGRDAGCPAPPAQIRAGPIRALGSYLGCLTAKRVLGEG